MSIVKIKNKNGLVWNRSGNAKVKAKSKDKITLYQDTGSNDQLFEMVYLGEFVYFISQNNKDLVINRRTDTGELMLYPYKNSTATDILFNTETVNGEMRIVMPHYSQYVTASGNANGAKLRTEGKKDSSTQYWKFDFITQNTDKDTNAYKLTMPVNANQKYNGYNSTVNKYGCAICCGLNVSSYFGNSANNNMEYFYKNYYGDNGYSWGSPNAIMTEDVYSLKKIKTEIDNQFPVIVHATDGSKQHWVVAYGYKNNCGSSSDVLVLDPYNASSSSKNGSLRTLEEAMNISVGKNHKFKRIKTTKYK